jgi:carbamoyl-phosphate synthase large subunit
MKYRTALVPAIDGVIYLPANIYSWLPEEFNAQVPFPLFIKPRDGVSNQHAYMAHTPEELKIFLARVPNPIIEEYIVGDHFNIDTLNDLRGHNLIAIPRQDFAQATGLSTKAQVVSSSELVAFGADVSEKFGIIGAANVEVFVRNGQILFSEINPRLSAGCVLSVVAGVNIPELHVDVFENRPISADKLKWREGTYMTRYWEEVYSRDEKYEIESTI